MNKQRPTLLSRLVLGLLLWLYRRRGWSIIGELPVSRRMVILGVPHTSNWDFIFFLGTAHKLGIKPRFMGKSSLFRWPMRRFMLDMGGVPVDRSRGGNYVEAMVAEIARHDEFALVIAPEGTRGNISGWKTGFYHIALGAGVPIVPAWVDNDAMRGGIGPAIIPSGDLADVLAKILTFYRAVLPDQPKLAALEATVTKAREQAAGR